jgi:hypothetical protein
MNNADYLLSESYSEKIRCIYQLYKANPNSLWDLAERGFLFAAFEASNAKAQYVDVFFEKVESVTTRNCKNVSEKEANTVPTGTLLFFDPSATMYDCLAEEFSDGLFDSDDVPPPEFWLGKWNAKLVSFIPSELFARANAGVEHCPSGSLEWGRQIKGSDKSR